MDDHAEQPAADSRDPVYRRDRRRPDGRRHRRGGGAGRCGGAPAGRVAGAPRPGAGADRRPSAPADGQGHAHRYRASGGARAHPDQHGLRGLSRLPARDRGRGRGRGGQARHPQDPDRLSARRRADRDQHLVDLDHAPGRGDRPARALHRHALHEPGAGDEAGRADPRHRHRRSDLPGDPRGRRAPRQDRRSPPRTSRRSSSTASCCR